MRYLLVAAITLSTPALADKFKCDSDRGYSPYKPVTSEEHDHKRFVPVIPGIAKEYTAYAAVFDDTDDDNGDGKPDLLMNPVLVAYQLNGVQPGKDGRYHEPGVSIGRPSSWYRAVEYNPLYEELPWSKKRLDDSYRGVGNTWNRGHLAMSDHAQRISAEAACDTHHFFNASPQAADLNQGPWRFLENYSAAAANKYEKLWVMTGPYFEPEKRIGYIGNNEEVPVAVPHGFYKILIREHGGKISALPFLYNQAYNEGTDNTLKPLKHKWVKCSKAKQQKHYYTPQRNIVSLELLEKTTGIDFRETLGSAEIHELLWPVEERYWDRSAACSIESIAPLLIASNEEN